MEPFMQQWRNVCLQLSFTKHDWFPYHNISNFHTAKLSSVHAIRRIQINKPCSNDRVFVFIHRSPNLILFPSWHTVYVPPSFVRPMHLLQLVWNPTYTYRILKLQINNPNLDRWHTVVWTRDIKHNGLEPMTPQTLVNCMSICHHLSS